MDSPDWFCSATWLMRWRNTALCCLRSSRAVVCTWGWKVCFSSLSSGKHWVSEESFALLNTIYDFYFNHWTLCLAGQAVKWTQGYGGSHESFSAVLVTNWCCLANLKNPLGSLKEQWAGCSCSISAWSLGDAPLVWQTWLYRLMMGFSVPQCEKHFSSSPDSSLVILFFSCATWHVGAVHTNFWSLVSVCETTEIFVLCSLKEWLECFNDWIFFLLRAVNHKYVNDTLQKYWFYLCSKQKLADVGPITYLTAKEF